MPRDAPDPPAMALTAGQQIRLACMERVAEIGRARQSAGKSLDQKDWREIINQMVAYVTTGNWPDANGTTTSNIGETD